MTDEKIKELVKALVELTCRNLNISDELFEEMQSCSKEHLEGVLVSLAKSMSVVCAINVLNGVGVLDHGSDSRMLRDILLTDTGFNGPRAAAAQPSQGSSRKACDILGQIHEDTFDVDDEFGPEAEEIDL